MKGKFLKLLATVIAVSTVISVFSMPTSALTNDNQIIDVEWHNCTKVLGIKKNEKELILSVSSDKNKIINLSLSFPKDGGVRLHADKTGYFSPDEVNTISYTEKKGIITLDGGAEKVKLNTSAKTWRFDVYDKNNNYKLSFSGDTLHFGYDDSGELKKVKAENEIVKNELLYGLGERFSGFIQNGKQVEMWNFDSFSQLSNSYGDQNVGYKNIPLVHSSRGYSIFHNNTYYGIFDMGATDSDVLSAEFYGPILDMYIWTDSADKNIAHYQTLTGNTILIPKWAVSYWAGQSFTVWSSNGEEPEEMLNTVKSTVEKYEGYNTPIKNIYAEAITDKLMYQNVAEYLQSKGIHQFAWMESSYRTFDDDRNANSISEKLGLVGTKLPLVRWNYQKLGYYWDRNDVRYLDYTNPNATQWLIERFRPFISTGLSGMMVDFNDAFPVDTYFSYINGTGDYMHNFSTYYYDKAVYDAFRYYYDEGEFVPFARAGCAGSQHFAASFAGDQTSTFLGLSQVVSGLLSSATSGFNIWGSDIGALGSSNDTNKHNPKLYARWLAFGTFSPLMRAHGQTGWRNPWDYDNVGQSTTLFQKYYWTRENLVDLIYSATVKASKENISMTKPMIVAFPEDEEIAENDNQYMFSDALLVCPVTEDGVSSLEVEFPTGRWVDLWSGEVYDGNQKTTVSATIDKIPVYVEGGAAFPVTYGEEIDIGTINTIDKNVEAILTAPAYKNGKVNKIYTDAENSYNLTTSLLDNGDYSLKSDIKQNKKIVVAMGASASKVSLDGNDLKELDEKPTSSATSEGFYVDYKNNSTIIVTNGDWQEVQYSDSKMRIKNIALGAKVFSEGLSEKQISDTINITDGTYDKTVKFTAKSNTSLTVDLGESVNIDDIVLRWGDEYARGYTLEGTNDLDSDSWTEIHNKKKGGGGAEIIDAKGGEFRYLRISNVTAANKKRPIELTEIEVYNSSLYNEKDGKLKAGINSNTVEDYLTIGLFVGAGVIIAAGILLLIYKKKPKSV